jgi:hypothetical protein
MPVSGGIRGSATSKLLTFNRNRVGNNPLLIYTNKILKIFQCGHCSILIFESYTCGHLSGFRDEDRKMLTFEPNDSL